MLIANQMDYVDFGNTGVKVSEICLGCMGFGTPEWRDWILDEKESKPIIERALDLGINFFDTANQYSLGESEHVLGSALEGHKEESFVATKVYWPMDEEDPNARGLSRKAIEHQLENSLNRLDMKTVDLYYIHRWDYDTPIRETLLALDDAVRREKIRYIGASSMWAYQFAKGLYTSDIFDLERFVAMQNHYNLVYREEEREMLPLCREENIAVVPWSPLARGYLARPREEIDKTTRGKAENGIYKHPYRKGGGKEINERVEELAGQKGVGMAQIALAWMLHKEWIDVPIVGTTSMEHLEQAVEATEIELSKKELNYLEEPYQPVRVSASLPPAEEERFQNVRPVPLSPSFYETSGLE